MEFCKVCKKEVDKVSPRDILNRTVYICDDCYEIILNLWKLLYYRDTLGE